MSCRHKNNPVHLCNASQQLLNSSPNRKTRFSVTKKLCGRFKALSGRSKSIIINETIVDITSNIRRVCECTQSDRKWQVERESFQSSLIACVHNTQFVACSEPKPLKDDVRLLLLHLIYLKTPILSQSPQSSH